MIIDFRLRPPYGNFLRIVAPYGRYGAWLRARLLAPASDAVARESMELTLQEMDEAGVTVGVVTGRATPPGVSNDEIAELCRGYPGRFVGIAAIDTGRRDRALDEARRALAELGMRGLALEPGLGTPPMDVDHASLYPLYEEAQSRGVPVVFTLSVIAGPDMGYCLRNVIATDRVAGDFRRLSIVVAHAGWPHVDAALGLALKRLNVYLSPDVYSFGLPPAQALFDAANGYLQDQYLFASAFPFYPLKPALERTAAGLHSDAVREKVCYANAKRLLKLP